jgi:hypothetical protein
VVQRPTALHANQRISDQVQTVIVWLVTSLLLVFHNVANANIVVEHASIVLHVMTVMQRRIGNYCLVVYSAPVWMVSTMTVRKMKYVYHAFTVVINVTIPTTAQVALLPTIGLAMVMGNVCATLVFTTIRLIKRASSAITLVKVAPTIPVMVVATPLNTVSLMPQACYAIVWLDSSATTTKRIAFCATLPA